MQISLYIARRLGAKGFTRLIIRFAVAGVSLSMAVMILAVGIVIGFKNEIKQKIVGYGGHIQIKNLDLNISKEARLINKNLVPADSLKTVNDNIDWIQPFTNKAGILQASGSIEGLLFKGVPHDYNWFFFKDNLKRGRLIRNNDSMETYEVMISEVTAERLNLDTGMRVEVFFIQDGQVRRRKSEIVGIFNTGLTEFDRMVVVTDMRVIQRIYTTAYDSVSGFEVFLKDFDRMGETAEVINETLVMEMKAQTAIEMNPVIFQWLQIVDTNAWVIIVLMLIVAIVNMITALLILIVDRTNMVGILKALGATNKQVRNIFMAKGVQLILWGLLIGNVLGVGSGLFQHYTQFMELDESVYYMNSVPFRFQWDYWLALNLGTLFLCFLVLFVPTLLARRITPLKAIRFG
jgi:lipoprotein-releasing system permease protein